MSSSLSRGGIIIAKPVCQAAEESPKQCNWRFIAAVVAMLGLAFAVIFIQAGHSGTSIAGPYIWVILGSILTVVSVGAVYFYIQSLKYKSENRKLAVELDSHKNTLSEKNEQLGRMKHLSEALINQVDLKPALDLALEMATDVIGAKTASIMLFAPSKQELTIAAASGLSEEIAANTRVKLGEGLAGLVAKEGEAIIINSDNLSDRLAPLAQRTHKIKSAIIAPIKIDGEIRGVINISDKRNAGKWEEEDIAVVSTLATQAAMVIRKIELYDSLQEQVYRLREALEELKTTQAGLIQSEKLASIGQLAGGVAHEINNPLMVILGRTELALEKLLPYEPIAKDLKVIHAQTERIAEIVRNLLDYSRVNRIDDFREVDVNELINNTLTLTEHYVNKHNISVVREIDEGLPKVWGNPGQINQVFVNIVINSYQAMGKRGGSLTISAYAEDGNVVVRFKDDGPGIPPELKEKIFEPFFTTKNESEGTGLGLAISRGIVHTHGGKIMVESEPGKGCEFFVELPVAEAVTLPLQEETENEQKAHNDSGRRNRNPRIVP